MIKNLHAEAQYQSQIYNVLQSSSGLIAIPRILE